MSVARRNLELKAADPAPERTLAAALTDTLGLRAVVEKERRLLIWRGVRIHLDSVLGLGHFVELEAVSDRIGGLPEEEARIAHLRSELGIEDDLLWDAATRICSSGSRARG